MFFKMLSFPFIVVKSGVSVVISVVKFIIVLISGIGRFTFRRAFGTIFGALVGAFLGGKHLKIKLFPHKK
jgi:hypothetical protein